MFLSRITPNWFLKKINKIKNFFVLTISSFKDRPFLFFLQKTNKTLLFFFSLSKIRWRFAVRRFTLKWTNFVDRKVVASNHSNHNYDAVECQVVCFKIRIQKPKIFQTKCFVFVEMLLENDSWTFDASMRFSQFLQ